jgi:hypothetical protein
MPQPRLGQLDAHSGDPQLRRDPGFGRASPE